MTGSEYGGYQASDDFTNLQPQQPLHDPLSNKTPQPPQYGTNGQQLTNPNLQDYADSPQHPQKDPKPPQYQTQESQPQSPYGSYSTEPQPSSQQSEHSHCDPSQWQLSKLVGINIVNIIFLSVWSGLLLGYGTSNWRSPLSLKVMAGITAGFSLAYVAFLTFWLLTACVTCWDPRKLHWTAMKIYVLVTFIPALFTFVRSILGGSGDGVRLFSFFMLYNISVLMFYIVKIDGKKRLNSTLESNPHHIGVQCFLVQYFAPFIFLGLLFKGLVENFFCAK